jgi:hypothetical protein
VANVNEINVKDLLRVLNEHDSLATNGRALTQSAGQRRAALRAELCKLMGEATYRKALKLARRLRRQTESDPRHRPRKKRYQGALARDPRRAREPSHRSP